MRGSTGCSLHLLRAMGLDCQVVAGPNTPNASVSFLPYQTEISNSRPTALTFTCREAKSALSGSAVKGRAVRRRLSVAAPELSLDRTILSASSLRSSSTSSMGRQALKIWKRSMWLAPSCPDYAGDSSAATWSETGARRMPDSLAGYPGAALARRLFRVR